MTPGSIKECSLASAALTSEVDTGIESEISEPRYVASHGGEYSCVAPLSARLYC